MMRSFFVILSCIMCYSDIEAKSNRVLNMSSHLKESSNIKQESHDEFLEGYIQALLDANYYEYQIVIQVQSGIVYVQNLPKNPLLEKSILAFIQDIPGVIRVDVVSRKKRNDKPFNEPQLQKREQIKSIWFPQSTLLFQPLIADPRNPGNSVAVRFDDDVMGKYAVAVSLGDIFPVLRIREVFSWNGDLQMNLVGCVWSVFNEWADDNPRGEIAELVNSDYLLSFRFGYAVDNYSYRFRVYHISSHLGDEFLAKRPGYIRKNPSMEAVDWFISYQASESLRLYAGPGWVFHSDPTYHLKPFYAEYGAEVRAFSMAHDFHNLYGTPFFAVHLRNWQAVDWTLDATIVAGYEWSRLEGIGRKFRLFGEYHNGYSEGEFFKDRTSYASIRASYGF